MPSVRQNAQHVRVGDGIPTHSSTCCERANSAPNSGVVLFLFTCTQNTIDCWLMAAFICFEALLSQRGYITTRMYES